MANGIGLLGVFDNHTDESGTSWFSAAYHQHMVGEHLRIEEREKTEGAQRSKGKKLEGKQCNKAIFLF